MSNFEREFSWDDTIQEDSKGWVELTPGDYVFRVTGFERQRHTPNPQHPGKLPACNKAVVSIVIETAEGQATLKHNLFLHSSVEGMLSAFFGAIGQKKHGEPLKMNWNAVTGATGVCRVGKRPGTGKYEGQQFDDIKSMIYADEVDWSKVLNPEQRPQAGYQQPSQPAQPQTPNFTSQGGQAGFGGF